ncbi:MAG TPA: FecR family protein, partial [Chthoniobacterales bacterium]|nr:FecR family protein [Chthoniobacterales bacterium]
MDSSFGTAKRRCLIVTAALAAIFLNHSAFGQQLQQARVTHIINDVRLLPSQAAPRPAVVNDEVKVGTAVRTGTDSRTELTFTDLTITRLGANTVFSFKAGTREVKLNSGAVLISVPPNALEVRVSTAAVSAAISGGTCIFDAATGKFMVFEGIGRVWPVGHPEKAVTVHAGEMVWITADGQISEPETFNVRLATETSLLFTEFPQQLPNWPLIVLVWEGQENQDGFPPPLPPNKTDQQIVSQRNDASPTASPTPTATPEEPTPTPTPEEPTPTPTPEEPTPTPTPQEPTPTPTPATPTPTPSSPTPTPSEFGPPQTITAPNPYVINGNTVITTDPTITTNGQTDFGTIYRGPEIDGPFSAFAFGSTSNFDTSSGFNAQIDDPGAVF